MAAVQKLLDMYVPPEGFELESLIATTYQVDFEFFEEELLATTLGVRTPSSRIRVFRTEIERSLRKKSVTVLYDLRGSPSAKRSSPQIDPIPIQDRKLHAKVTLLMWVRLAQKGEERPVRRVRLILGSANLTRSGFRENYECVASIDFGGIKSPRRALLEDAIKFVGSIGAGPQSPTLARQLGEFQAFAETIPANSQVQNQPIDFVSADTAMQILRKEWDALDGTRPSLVTVVSPFWPDGGTAAQAMKTVVDILVGPERVDLVCRGVWGPNRVDWVPEFDPILAVELRSMIKGQLFLRPTLPDASVAEEDNDKGDETETEEIGRALPDNKPAMYAANRALHAKMILVDGDKGSVIYIGSSNCTRRGLRLGGPTSWEAGLIYRLSRPERNRLQRLLDMAGKAVEVLPGKAPTSVAPIREPDAPVPSFVSEIVATRTTVTIWFQEASSIPQDLVILMPIPARLEDTGYWVLYPQVNSKVDGKQLNVVLADAARCDERQNAMPPLSEAQSFGPNVYVDVFWEGKTGTFPVRFDDKASLPILIAGRRSTEGELIDYFLFGREPDLDDDGSGGNREADPHSDKDAPIDTRRILAYFMRRFVQAIPGIEAEIDRANYSRVALEATLRGPTSPLELAERAFASLSQVPAADEPIKTPTAVGFQLVELVAALKRCRNRISDKELQDCFDPVLNRCIEMLDQVAAQSPSLNDGSFAIYRNHFIRNSA